jgi:SAM-dependent methyltransferase
MGEPRFFSENSAVFERVELGDPHDAALFYDQNVVRYRFACQFVARLRVLDIACGDGYGTEMLASSGEAVSVLGVDSWRGIACSRRPGEGIWFLVTRAECLPIKPESFDVVVSMETIEHLEEPTNFLEQLRQALVPGGLAIISTPLNNKESRLQPDNPYHRRENSAQEFRSLTTKVFGSCDLWSQITDYEDDLSFGSLTGPGGASRLRRTIRAVTPSGFRRAARMALGSKGLHPVGSRIVPGIAEGAHVQIALCRNPLLNRHKVV